MFKPQGVHQTVCCETAEMSVFFGMGSSITGFSRAASESCRFVCSSADCVAKGRSPAFMTVSPTGRMYLFYGNKTSVQFASFTTTVSCPGELQSHILSCSSWRSAEADTDPSQTVCLCGELLILSLHLINLNSCSQLNVQSKPVEPLVEGGAQIQQVLNIECLTDFSEAPLLNIKFR